MVMIRNPNFHKKNINIDINNIHKKNKVPHGIYQLYIYILMVDNECPCNEF